MMNNKSKIGASEFGALWVTYHKKTMILRFLEHFIHTSDNKKAKQLLTGLHGKLNSKVEEMKELIQKEGTVVPAAFSSEDINLDAPALFSEGFDIMFSRILKEISLGMYTLHIILSHRKDLLKLYKELSDLSQIYFAQFTEFLLEEGILQKPITVNLPKSTSFVTDKSYFKGSHLLGGKRQLNVVEFGFLYHGIETNVIGMKLMEGFSQCAKDEEVKKYFLKGKELSKEMISETEKILLQNDIQPNIPSGGTTTNSSVAPFSDKLMMYCAYLLSNFSIGGEGFGTGFSMRRDLNLKFGIFGKDTYEYMREGVSIMISNGWLEEPPKMDV